MRDHLILWVNGLRHEVRGGDAFLMLGDWLRERLGLTGTKLLCAEGDCGVCTVLVAEPATTGTPRYLPVNACLRFLFQLDGCHVVTVDGLSRDGDLAPVQQAMVDCHGSQCGFCTPGMVMTLTGSCHAAAAGTDIDWRKELSGNLCRCTGYVSIFEAAAQARREPDWLAGRFADADWMPEAARRRRESLELQGESGGAALRVTSPATLTEALAARRQPGARVVAGGTDLGVLWNQGKLRPQHWLDLSRLPDLRGVAFEGTGDRTVLVAGALASWTRLLDACRERLPQAVPIFEAFGGPQIRHVGTLGGNLVNGSPIADSLPLLFVLEATLDLASAAGTRAVPIESFYRGYRQVDLGADELLVGVRMPLPRPDDRLRLVKVARRRDLDISTFTSAVLLRRAGDRIESARLACGGVGPTVVRLRRTEAFLAGRPFTEDSFREAGEVAAGEIQPITDVRGSAEYRRQLARGALLRFFHEEVASA